MKKTISIFLSLLMLFAFSACGSGDDDENTSPTDVSNSPTSPSDIEIPEPTPTPEPQPVSELSICGIPVVSNGQPTGIGYKGAEYDNGVLTLDGLDILADSGSANAIYFVGDLEIVLSGENTITATNAVSAIVGGTAEDGGISNLIISGDGSLTVTSDFGYGLSCSGAVSVNCGALDITGAEAAVEGGADTLMLGEGLVLAGDSLHVSVGTGE